MSRTLQFDDYDGYGPLMTRNPNLSSDVAALMEEVTSDFISEAHVLHISSSEGFNTWSFTQFCNIMFSASVLHNISERR